MDVPTSVTDNWKRLYGTTHSGCCLLTQNDGVPHDRLRVAPSAVFATKLKMRSTCAFCGQDAAEVEDGGLDSRSWDQVFLPALGRPKGFAAHQTDKGLQRDTRAADGAVEGVPRHA